VRILDYFVDWGEVWESVRAVKDKDVRRDEVRVADVADRAKAVIVKFINYKCSS